MVKHAYVTSPFTNLQLNTGESVIITSIYCKFTFGVGPDSSNRLIVREADGVTDILDIRALSAQPVFELKNAFLCPRGASITCTQTSASFIISYTNAGV